MIKMIITCSSYRVLKLQLTALLINIYKICICSQPFRSGVMTKGPPPPPPWRRLIIVLHVYCLS